MIDARKIHFEILDNNCMELRSNKCLANQLLSRINSLLPAGYKIAFYTLDLWAYNDYYSSFGKCGQLTELNWANLDNVIVLHNPSWDCIINTIQQDIDKHYELLIVEDKWKFPTEKEIQTLETIVFESIQEGVLFYLDGFGSDFRLITDIHSMRSLKELLNN